MAVAVVAVALIAGGGLTLLAGRHGGGAPAASSSPGATSTDPNAFVLPRLIGSGTVGLADFRGRPLVVNFFASWCTPCRGEAPGFVAADRDLHGAVAFLGVDSLDTGNGAAFAREVGYARFTLAHDVDGSLDSGLHDALGAVGMPATAFYSREGKRLHLSLGALSQESLRALIRDLFGVPLP